MIEYSPHDRDRDFLIWRQRQSALKVFVVARAIITMIRLNLPPDHLYEIKLAVILRIAK